MVAFVCLKLALLMILGFPAVARCARQYVAYTVDYPAVYEIAGYDFASRLEVFKPFDSKTKSHSFRRPDGLYTVRWTSDSATILISHDEKTIVEASLTPLVFAVRDYLARHLETRPASVPQSVLKLTQTGPGAQMTAYFDDLSAELVDGKPIFYHFKADLFLKLANQKPK